VIIQINFLKLFLLVVTIFFHLQVNASCSSKVINGINIVGHPSGWYEGKTEVVFPKNSTIKYYKNVGMNAIRLPIEWERIQPKLFGDLNQRYLSHIKEFLNDSKSNQLKVVLDLHNYGRYESQLIGSKSVPDTAFKDIWFKLANEFKNDSTVFAYGLMNEPHDTNGLWHKVAQSGVDGIRKVDSNKTIYVGGDGWSGAMSWPDQNPHPFVIDPKSNIVYEAHIYFDDNFSGKYKNPQNSNVDLKQRVNERVLPFINWLKKYKQVGIIGEVGVPMDDDRWLIALDRFLNLSKENCLGWFMWSGGNWRPSYELSLEPINGKDRPQINMIRHHLQTKN
jgi:endoglucanase